MRYNITAIFFCIDEFSKAFEEWEKHRLIDTGRKRHRSCEMSLSEMLTIMVMSFFAFSRAHDKIRYQAVELTN